MQTQLDTNALNDIVEEALTGALPRVAAAIASRQAVVWAKAGGHRSCGEAAPEGEVTLETPFALFSQTKLVTALCALQLLEQGKIKLDDPAELWVPELREKKILTGYSEDGRECYEEPTNKVTVRDLFCHTGGLPYTPGNEMLERFRKEHGLEKQVEGLRGDRAAITAIPFIFNPGTKLQYSTGIDYLGYIVEAVSGLDLEVYTQRYIMDPLQINDTVYRRDQAYLAKQVNLVRPVVSTSGATTFEPAPFTNPTNPESCGGGGGLHGSAGSFIKILQALLNDGQYEPNGNRILQPETVDLLFTHQLTDEHPPEIHQALDDWQHLDQDPFHRSLTNGGGDPATVPRRARGWGMGSALNMEDLPRGRRAGTLYGSGFGDTFWWIDRRAGLCATFMVNTTSRSPGVFDFWERLETEIYRPA